MSELLLTNFDLLATAPGGVARLRELILTLAVQGKLVLQDPSDEPAIVLLQRVQQGSTSRSAKIRKLNLPGVDDVAPPYALPSGWSWSRLGDLVENMGSGWSPACDEGERSDPERWAVLRTTAVQLNEYRPREHKVIPIKLSPRPEIEVKEGDILITRAGPMNRVGISCWVDSTPPRLMLSDKIVRFHSIADEMLPAFIVLALNSGWTKSLIEAAKTGMAASQVNISQADLRALWMPVCSKAEQSRIVARVEELMRLCDALEAKGQLDARQHAQLVRTLLDTLTDSATPEELAANWQRVAAHFDLLLDRPEAVDALEQTILQLAVRGLLVSQDPSDEPASVLLRKIRAEKDRLIAEGKIKRDKPLAPISDEEKPFELPVGWEWVRLGAAAKKITDGTHHSPASFSSGDFMYLSAKNIKSWGIDLSSATFIPKAVHDEIFSRCDPEYGDILCIKDGATTGVLAINTIREPFSLLSSVGVIKPSCGLTSEYIALVMKSPFFYQAMRAGMTGVAITRVTLSKLGNAMVPLPPLTEQSRIVARVEELRRLCADLRARLATSRTTQGHLAEALVEATGTL